MLSVDEEGVAVKSEDCKSEDSAACELRGEQAKLIDGAGDGDMMMCWGRRADERNPVSS